MHNDSKPKYFQQIKVESKSIYTNRCDIIHISYDILRQNLVIYMTYIGISRQIFKLCVCSSMYTYVCVCVCAKGQTIIVTFRQVFILPLFDQ